MGEIKFTIAFRVLVILSLFALSESLYEDQIGKFDWRRQYIGRVEQAYFSPLSRRITVATNQNVVASLNLRNGNLMWRQIYELGKKGQVDEFQGWKDEVLVLSGDGTILRYWDVSTGYLLWEIPIVFSSPDETIINNFYRIIPKEEQVLVISFTDSFTLHVSCVNFTSQSFLWTKTSAVPWRSPSVNCQFIDDEYFICAEGNNVHSLKLGPVLSFTTTQIPVVGEIHQAKPIEVRQLHSGTDKPTHLFSLKLGFDRTVLATIKNDNVVFLRNLTQVITMNVIELKGEVLVFYITNQDDQIKLESIPLDNLNSISSSVDLEIPSHHGKPEKMWISVVSRKDGEPSYRVLLTTQDDGLILLQINGKMLWSKEEALASVVSVEMIDLPVSDSDIQFEQEFRFEDANILSMLLKRLTSQLFQLESSIMAVINGLNPTTNIFAAKTHPFVTRDVFNLNKVIVLVSQSGKIFGMDSSTGNIIWQTFVPNLRPFDNQQLLLFTQTKTAHFAHIPQCAVIGTNKLTGKGLIYQFHPITGEEIHGGIVNLDFYIAQVVLIPDSDDNYVQGFLFLDTQGMVHTYPESALSIARRISPSLFIYIANRKSGVLSGYSLSNTADEKLIAVPVWNINLPESHTIFQVVAKQPYEHVHSQGRVMSDRSVTYKYLNPNLVAVVTGGNDSQLKPFFNVILVDVITGNIIYSGIHKRSRGPVRLVLSENWVVYTYYNEKARRNELSVLELYEGKIQSNTTAFSSLDPPQPPMVEKQAYLFTPGLDAMAVTITEKGITSKHILFAMPNGGIVELPKSLLDPRRSVMPTKEQREESIYPYIPELPVHSENIINYNQSVYRIREISTAPAGLESTCLVLAFGLDLFFSRITPSRTFDVLKDDFDHFLIAVVLLALILSAYLIRQLAARKALRQAWK